MSIKSIYKSIRFWIRDVLYNRKLRIKLSNHDFSLITSDCTGGCIAKDLKVRMNSPTRRFVVYMDCICSFAHYRLM